jgi:hypothetical protein
LTAPANAPPGEARLGEAPPSARLLPVQRLLALPRAGSHHHRPAPGSAHSGCRVADGVCATAPAGTGGTLEREGLGRSPATIPSQSGQWAAAAAARPRCLKLAPVAPHVCIFSAAPAPVTSARWHSDRHRKPPLHPKNSSRARPPPATILRSSSAATPCAPQQPAAACVLARSSSAAMMTTEVVPSPTSVSCSSARSTNTFAAGCSTSSCFRMVAPSFVMVTSPMLSTCSGVGGERGASASCYTATASGGGYFVARKRA